jgi:hypothetical protein
MAVGNIDIHFDQTGGTSSFTYSFGSCKAKNNKLEFKYDKDINKWLSVSKDDTLINLTARANTDPDRNVDVGIYLNSNSCGNFIVTQDGVNCSCNDATFHVDSAANPFPSGGDSNATLGSYRIDAKCMNTPTIDQSTVPNWIKNVNFNGTSITGVVEPNSSVESRPQATIWLRGTLKPSGTCDRSITVNQDGTGCSCDNIDISNVIPIIPREGLEVDSVLANYTILNDCGENLYTAILTESSTEYLVELVNGDVLLKTEVPGVKTHDNPKIFILQFKYNNTDCTEKRYEIEQPTIDCSCKSIGIFITSYYRHFDNNGSNGQYVLLATGDTMGCGTLDARCGSVMTGDDDIKVTPLGDNKYKFEAIITSNKYYTCQDCEYKNVNSFSVCPECGGSNIRLEEGARRTAGVTFSVNGIDCVGKEMELIQEQHICTCQNTGGIREPEGTNRVVSCNGSSSWLMAYTTCATLVPEVISDDDWLEVYSSYSPAYGQVNAYAKVKKNSSEKEREATVRIRSYIDYINTEYAHGGVLCEEKIVKVKQEACVTCDCYSFDVRCSSEKGIGSSWYFEYKDVGAQYVGSSYKNGACEGRAYWEGSSYFDPTDGDYKYVFCGWDEEYDHSWIEGDPYINCSRFDCDENSSANWMVDFKDKNTSGRVRKARFYVGVSYYGGGVWSDACTDNRCTCGISIQQNYSHCSDCTDLFSDLKSEYSVSCEEQNNITVCWDYSLDDKCDYVLKATLLDSNRQPTDYDWCSIHTNYSTSIGMDFSNNEGETEEDIRSVFILLEIVDMDTHEIPSSLSYCNRLIEVKQDICHGPECTCENIITHISTTDFDNQFTFVPNGTFYVGRVHKVDSRLDDCLRVLVDSTHTGGTDHYFDKVEFVNDDEQHEDYYKIMVTFTSNIDFSTHQSLLAKIDVKGEKKNEISGNWENCSGKETDTSIHILKP